MSPERIAVPIPADVRLTNLREKMADRMGYYIVTCPCCGAWPYRSSWGLRTCPSCGRALCRKYLDDGATVCVDCLAKEGV